MSVPVLLPTAARDESFAGVTYHIQGELVPALSIEINAMPVYFEHHVLLWKDPQVQIGVKAIQGAFKRMVAGMPVFLTEARGPGRIAFSRDGAGHVFAIHLAQGQSLDVREHQFLAATESLEYGFSRIKGVSNILFGGTGFFVDRFAGSQAAGILWLHGYGNVFDATLAPGEQIDIEPGGWVYKEPTVRMESLFQRLSTGFLASAGQISWNRFTGPGRVGLQSMNVHLPTAE
ncbi:MAG TPA: AIM24 family protein [Terriglobia bacterium]|nr:AIM24 family protein [Terriglobia bacterium]